MPLQNEQKLIKKTFHKITFSKKSKGAEINMSRAQNPYGFPRPEHKLHYWKK
jgi:hypothetical protein